MLTDLRCAALAPSPDTTPTLPVIAGATWVAGPAVLGVVLHGVLSSWRRDRVLLRSWLAPVSTPEPEGPRS